MTASVIILVKNFTVNFTDANQATKMGIKTGRRGKTKTHFGKDKAIYFHL